MNQPLGIEALCFASGVAILAEQPTFRLQVDAIEVEASEHGRPVTELSVAGFRVALS